MKNTNGESKNPELDELVQRIGYASKALNAAAGEATRRIEAFEENLIGAEPGISVWGDILLSEKASFQSDEGGPVQSVERVVTLGFDKLKKDKWGLAVREELKGQGGTLHEEVTLLRKADRTVRILAIAHLEALGQQILKTLEGHVGLLESTRQEPSPQANEQASAAAHAEA